MVLADFSASLSATRPARSWRRAGAVFALLASALASAAIAAPTTEPTRSRARPPVAVTAPTGRTPDALTASLALALVDAGFVVVGSRTLAPIAVQAATTSEGGGRVEISANGAIATRAFAVDPGPFPVVRLEAEAQTLSAVLEASRNVPASNAAVPAVVLDVTDVRDGKDREQVRRVSALRLLRAGYALGAKRTKEAVLVCVRLRQDDAVVGAAPPGAPACSLGKRRDRGTEEGGPGWLSDLASLVQNRADLALAGPNNFDLGQSQTSVPYGGNRNQPQPDREMLGDDVAGNESFLGDFAPRRAFVSGHVGAVSRGRAADPSARVLFRTEHSRRLGLGVILDVTNASDANVFALEFTGLVGLTYALDLDYGFSAVLGAFGGGRAHAFNLENPLLVANEGQARDGIAAEFVVAALMGVRYQATPTFAVVGTVLFNFGEERIYRTAQRPLWARAAGGIGPSIGLEWQLPILEGADAL